jgi:hypothetical protein
MDNIASFKMIKKCIDPKSGEINKLIQDDKIAAADILPEAAAGRGGKNKLTPQLFQGKDVRPVINLGRWNGMITGMPGEDKNFTMPDGTGEE